MIEITENAGRQIHRMLERHGLPAGGLRVGVKAGGCSGLSYVFAWDASPRDGDEVFQGPHDSRVFVDPKCHSVLAGTVLDYDTSLLSKGFLFSNPNAKSSCGCGVSFSVS